MTTEQLPLLKVAVVGHTNTGKTSLLRTLTQDVDFGEVSDRPSTTRHVEGAVLEVDGKPLVELYDTPGMEDASGLLDYLDSQPAGRYAGPEQIDDFLASPAAQDEFEQEAKVLRQVLGSEVALYVVDCREPVLGKYQDELTILGLCARPVLPVLNFISSPYNRATEWREQLARVNLHAVVGFDTVVLEEDGERRLFEKLQTLLDHYYQTLECLITERAQQQSWRRKAAAELLAELLIDVAGYRSILRRDERESGQSRALLSEMQTQVRAREQECVQALLHLYRFDMDDYRDSELPLRDGQWGMDLFNPEALKQYGLNVSGAAAVGAMAGLAVDAMFAGLSLGVATATGAALGAIWSTGRGLGRKLYDRLRGFSELRVADSTLRLLALRQLALIEALARRGHASQQPIHAALATGKVDWKEGNLPDEVLQARANPQWSRLNREEVRLDERARLDALARLATRITPAAK